jgi:hypothetical protein
MARPAVARLILDEAHHAAPASGGRYGIETKLTRAVRDLAGRFEHRLFLSATPHNGHSNSFSTLLELLDPYRFTRGVKVRGKRALDDVMVRRLKEDIREIQGGFPKRLVVRILIDELPDDAPDLVLSRLLDNYRTAREERFAGTARRAQAAAGLLVVGLQQRLLSSIEAFARSLKVHRATVQRQWERGHAAALGTSQSSDIAELFTKAPNSDDERGEWTPEELEADETAQIEVVTTAAEANSPRDANAEKLWRREQSLLVQMQAIVEKTRYLPDAKMRRLIDWIRENLCPGLPEFGTRVKGTAPAWNEARVLIFTENREGTKRHLKSILEQAIEVTDRADERIEVMDGLTSSANRKEIQQRQRAAQEQHPGYYAVARPRECLPAALRRLRPRLPVMPVGLWRRPGSGAQEPFVAACTASAPASYSSKTNPQNGRSTFSDRSFNGSARSRRLRQKRPSPRAQRPFERTLRG